ncbi:MAG: PHP domain-containing protein [Gemmatimonadetes bacterium]|nr:PHP domain-containing protein [Gemmatimonadota bacterium]MCC7133515.1 PHP domain-containing protein [Gemmatimonadales bacterium]
MDHAGTRVPPLSAFADLHLHSTASDGTLAPSEVVRLGVEAGLAAIGLTDHDTVAGVAEARAAGLAAGIRVVAGCEFSVGADGGEVHLLGYALPDTDPELLTTLDRMRAARADRGHAMVARIAACGIPLEYADVEREAAGAPIGRPHVARALIARKAVRSIEEAFDRLLGRGRPAFVPKALPELAEICDLIRRVGGVSSIAHPKDRLNRAALEELRAQGLDAIEVCHPSHSGPVRANLERLAAELGLLPTGGSDSHGAAAASPSHAVVGGERIPIAWVDRLEALAASRRAPSVS